MIFYRVYDPEGDEQRSEYFTRKDDAVREAHAIANDRQMAIDVDRVFTITQSTHSLKQILLLALNGSGVIRSYEVVATILPKER